MVKQRINRKLSFGTSAMVILTATLIVSAVELRALHSKEAPAKAGGNVNAAECVRCHSDQKSINMMRLKEDGTNYLFNSDGSFRDSKLAGLTANYRHVGARQGAVKSKLP